MRKGTKLITLDPILRRWAEDNITNFSGWVEGQVNTLKKMYDDPTEEQKQIDELQDEIEDLMEKKRQMDYDISAKVSRIQQLKQQQEEEKLRVQRMEKEAELQSENAKRCQNCGEWLGNQVHRTPIGNVCNVCFWAQPKEKMQEWLKWQKENPTK